MKIDDPRVLRAAEGLVALFDLMRASVPSAGPAHYTSKKGGPHPPGKTARWCREKFRGIPGARKEGRDWVVPVTAYERWTERNAAAAVPRASTNLARAGEWSPRAALAAAEIRETRRKS